MEYVRFAVKFASLALIVILIGGYCYLIYNGDVPKPDLGELDMRLKQVFSSGTVTIAGAAIIICCALTAIAPFIYAARSGDFFTIIVSIVALVVCFALLAYSRTVIDMVLAAIVYFTSAFVSVVMYSTNRISDAIAGRASEDDLPVARPVGQRRSL